MMKKILFCLFIMALFALNAQQALAAAELSVIKYHYQTHFTAGETVTFRISVRNSGDTNLTGVYLSPVLTNNSTGAEVYPSGTATQNINVGLSATFTTTWTAVAGKYSVSLILYRTGDVETVREYGAYPIRVGSSATTEQLSVFPTIMDFGVLPYGRHMHPVPIEITWDYFIYNRNRHQRPWYMRIYTNNASRYKGLPGIIYQTSPAGLVSSDGRYSIPLKIWCLNYAPDDQEMGWDTAMSGPPPVDEDTYWKGPLLDEGKRYHDKVGWERIPDLSEMTSDRRSWRTLIGESRYDEQYVTDINAPGDFTLTSPFSAYLAMETGPTSVKGNYSCELIVEIYSP